MNIPPMTDRAPSRPLLVLLIKACGPCVEHSDPERLRQMASSPELAAEGMGLEERRERVQALMEEMKTWPTEAELVHESLVAIYNTSSPKPERVLALKILQELVEQIDVANGEKRSLQRPGKFVCMPILGFYLTDMQFILRKCMSEQVDPLR
jgi:hypothetical protein